MHFGTDVFLRICQKDAEQLFQRTIYFQCSSTHKRFEDTLKARRQLLSFNWSAWVCCIELSLQMCKCFFGFAQFGNSILTKNFIDWVEMKSYHCSKIKRHPSEGVLWKSCSENLLKIPRKTSVIELILNIFTIQLLQNWMSTGGCLLDKIQYKLCHWCFSWNFPKIFRTAMSKSNCIFMQCVL